MIDISTDVVTQLKTVGTTYYEMFLDKSTLPCISYQQIENNNVSSANKNGYSRITFKIKVWANDLATINSYSQSIDNKLAEIGPFNRRSTNEVVYGNTICRVMDYSILMPETFSTPRI